MAVHDVESEQLEQIRRWWDENGTAVILGLALGLGGLFGWRYWQARQIEAAEAASVAFQQAMAELTRDGHGAQAAAIAESIVDRHPDTGYAEFARLLLARLAVEDGRLDDAVPPLEAAIENAPDPALEALARIRRARVALARGELDAAWRLVDGDTSAKDWPLWHEVRGDILRARGDLDRAREAYRLALATAGPTARAALELKLDDVGREAADTPQ